MGRPVAFAFAGTPPEADGSSVFLTAARMKDSLNYKSVLEGLAYPTYYKGLFSDLRNELTQAAITARAAKPTSITNRLSSMSLPNTGIPASIRSTSNVSAVPGTPPAAVSIRFTPSATSVRHTTSNPGMPS